jgi:hypothetical protein
VNLSSPAPTGDIIVNLSSNKYSCDDQNSSNHQRLIRQRHEKRNADDPTKEALSVLSTLKPGSTSAPGLMP